MDNSNCYWCDYLIDKIDTSEEGYYCTFNPENIIPCSLELVCPRYVAADKVQGSSCVAGVRSGELRQFPS